MRSSRDEHDFTGGVELGEAERTGFGVEDAVVGGAVGSADGAGSDEDGAFDAGFLGVASTGRRGDRDDREQSAFAQEFDEVHAAEGAVVDHTERAGQQGSEPSDALERDGRFAADVGDRRDREDHAAVGLVVAHRDHDVLGAPGGFAAAGDV